MFIGISVFLVFFFWMNAPIVYNIVNHAYTSNGTVLLQTCLYMMAPFDYEKNIKNWVFMHLLNVYIAGFGCALLAVTDTLLYSVIFHLSGRIDILKYNMKTLYGNIKSIPENKVHDVLKKCIEDYRVILK